MHGLFRWSSKWWPGTIPLAVLWALAAWNSTLPLEADLAARSNAALRDTVLDKARMAVAGRDVTFAADAFSEDGRRSAVASVEAVPGVRLVDDQTRLVPEAKPFAWSAERDVARVTLGGSSPLPAIKNRLLEAARAGLGGTEVVDLMNLSRGAPPRFDNAALLLLDQIAKLKDGKVTLLKDKLALKAGEVIDAAVMSRRALRKFYAEQIEAARKERVLLSLHLKATMMKVSDPIMFGHAVSVFFKDAFDKHGELLQKLNVNVNNGFGVTFHGTEGVVKGISI